MANCRNCGKPLIINGGKCIYCSTPCGEKKGEMNKTVQPGLPPVRTFTVNGVSFNMILVEGGTMWLGEQNSDPRKPNYDLEAERDDMWQEKIDTFYIGETLVTQELAKTFCIYHPWHSFYENKDHLIVKDEDNLPAICSFHFNESFISELMAQTGELFRLPSENEWEFAARGGCKSKGYRFAGSNVLTDVGWYQSNSFFGYYTSKEGGVGCQFRVNGVKMKNPNELGLYDMSGLVPELCVSRYGGEFRLRGGRFDKMAPDCRVSAPSGPYSTYSMAGIRLAMTPKYERARQ